MPTVDRDGVTLRYDVAGDGPTVAFVNDVGFGAWCWSYQHPAVAGPYEAVVWDLRGTGESDAPDGPYDLTTLVADLEAVLSAVDARRVHLVGMGLGGAVALEYARRHGRAASLLLLGTAPGSAVDADALASLAAPLEDRTALGPSLEAAFAPGVRESYPEEVERIAAWRATDDAAPPAHAAQRAAWLEAPLADRPAITTPALVLSGTDDRIVDPTATERLARDLPGGTHRAVAGGHLFPVSESAVVTDELLGWLDTQAVDPPE